MSSHRANDLAGMTFGRLFVIERIGSKNNKALWLCMCECGNEHEATGVNLNRGYVKSCGCLSSSYKTGETKLCKMCGKETYIKKSHLSVQGTYCSRKCMSEDYKLIMNNSDNPNYRHGKSRTRDYLRPYGHRRRSSVRGATGSFSYREIEEKLKEQDDVCYWCFECLEGRYHADHIIPIARGGSNTIANIAISCEACNAQKGSKLVDEWLEHAECRSLRGYDYDAGEYS